jgi:hypothetical protein
MSYFDAIIRERSAKIPSQAWNREPAVEGRTACLTCGCGAHDTVAGDRWIAVGFGSASLTKNGRNIWSEDELPRDDYGMPPTNCPDPLTVADAEKLAAEDPEADWRISFHAPLYDAVYQRQGEGHWVLIESGEGFA